MQDYFTIEPDFKKIKAEYLNITKAQLKAQQSFLKSNKYRFYSVFLNPNEVERNLENVLTLGKYEEFNLKDYKTEILYICLVLMEAIKEQGDINFKEYYTSELRAIELAKLMQMFAKSPQKLIFKPDNGKSVPITDEHLIPWIGGLMKREIEKLSFPYSEFGDALIVLFGKDSLEEGDLSERNLNRIADMSPIDPVRMINFNIGYLCTYLLKFLKNETLLKAEVEVKFSNKQLDLLLDISKLFGLLEEKSEDIDTTSTGFLRSILIQYENKGL